MAKIPADANREVLSSAEYWDTVLKDAKLPRINQYKDYYITMDFIDSVLSTENKKTFMEIGAGSSGWLPYFANKYRLKVSGLDYSEIGCKLAIENLRLLNIDFDEIICQDIFEWQGDKKYDVIFSYGVVEHFENPERILKICYDHLSPDGIIITLVPNLRGVMGKWSQKYVPEIFKIHKVISREELTSLHQQAGFQNIKTDYAGTFSIGVIPWIRSDHFLFKEKSLLRKISLLSISGISKVSSLINRAFGVNKPSEKWSPYLISIMRKQ